MTATGHGHGHGQLPQDESPGEAGRARAVLVAVVVPILLATALALALLWPRGALPEVQAARDAYQGVSFEQGRVQRVLQKACAGDSTDRLADGTIPATVTCVSVEVVLTTGPSTGKTVSFGLPPEAVRSGVVVGDLLEVVRYPPVQGQGEVFAYIDFARQVPMTVLAGVFAVLVVLVARWRGLLSLVGLGLAYAMIAYFVLPALRHQESPLLVGAVGATAIMSVILYLAHGVSRKTSTAFLGTVAGIWTSAGLAWWVTGAAHLNGLTSEENLQLNKLTPFADLGGLVLCGIILAGLGVLNDVTITQASAVWELHQAAPGTSSRRLFRSGMQIGRDHLASTVYTLAFAYAGAALPTILLGSIYGRPLGQWLTSGEIAEEIARSLVASVGLILAIPLTTAIGCLVVRGVGHTPRAPLPRLADLPDAKPRGRRAAGTPTDQPPSGAAATRR